VRLDGELEVRGVALAMSFPAVLTEAADDAVSVTGEVVLDRKAYGVKRGRLGMLVGGTTASFELRFIR
jgi:polyisoprenoid-binding protein YceI